MKFKPILSPRRSEQPTFVEGEHFTVDANGCWIWRKYINPFGYGYLSWYGVTTYAHRHSWAQHRGEIPEGLELDHLCRVRECINPDHLEPVTRSENQRRGKRGFGLTGMCREGLHEAVISNIYVNKNSGHRRCRPCATAKRREYNQRRRDALRVEHGAEAVRSS